MYSHLSTVFVLNSNTYCLHHTIKIEKYIKIKPCPHYRVFNTNTHANY